jgi:purine-nucleoside/S-methyl-5'-thioadenosine phosphorylase / adenosine deaminase
MIQAPNFKDLEWLEHGFGLRDSILPPGIRTAKQIHSSIVLDAAEGAGEGDALISDRAGVTVGVRTADCVPILLVDPSIPAVAAIHAGWRGSAENIASKAVRCLADEWHTLPGNLRAAIGPAIGVCCYEVGLEVAKQFEQWIPVTENRHLDLPAINERQLRAAGVADIWKSGECTFCAPDRFFSFRREREKAGRMMSFIGLQKHVGRTAQL